MPDTVEIELGPLRLKGLLGVPSNAEGLVIFAHGSGSGRLSPRNNRVATKLRSAGLTTLLLDLLTPEEEQDRANVFDISLLASRLSFATDWSVAQSETRHLPIGYFGASTGAGAALVAAAVPRSPVAAIVSRGGRPDLAGDALVRVNAARRTQSPERASSRGATVWPVPRLWRHSTHGPWSGLGGD
jgi:putative phosphoribosyl transferase